MITKEQLRYFSKLKKINEYVVLREYLQLWFLSELYKEKFSEDLFFKGGTALHIIFGMDRFSEDLDFSVVNLKPESFEKYINKFFKNLSQIENVSFKEKRSLTGKRIVLIFNESLVEGKVFINLDFSFREKVVDGKASIVKTDYPIIFTSFVNHLSPEEILAEKIRALLTREKGRDLYDIWFLLNQGTKLNGEIIKEKLKYYKLKEHDLSKILDKIEKFNKKDFIIDLRPFVSANNREKLSELFDYIVEYLKSNIRNILL